MIVECELIGGAFDGHIHINNTKDTQHLGLSMPLPIIMPDGRYRYDRVDYMRKSIESTKYYIYNTKRVTK